ncbi:MAG TPA: hypothetical protein PLQ93_03190 [Bacteroidia bacterium]|nr:hypothetical protein [Bacteroidia bacterium]
MKAEEEFDDIFRRKIDEARFSIRDSDWENARRLIDRNRTGTVATSSAKMYWLVSGVVALGASTLLYLAVPESGKSTLADEVIQEQENTPEPKTTRDLHQTLVLASTAQTQKTNSLKHETDLSVHPNTPVKPTSLKMGSAFAGKAGHNHANLATNHTAQGPNLNLALSGETAQQGSAFNTQDYPSGMSSESLDAEHSQDKHEILWLPYRSASMLSQFMLPAQPEIGIKTIKGTHNDYYVSRQNKRNYLDVEVGVLYLNGWENKGIESGKGPNLFAGINYGFHVSKNLIASVGVQVYTVRHMNDEFYSVKGKTYGFSSSETQSVISCQSMAFASVPVKLYYKMDDQNLLGLGVNAGYLVSARNNLDTYTLNDGAPTLAQSQNNKQQYENMSSLNLVLSAGLQHEFGSGFSAGIEYNYGLSDLIANSQINNTLQNTSGFRLSLKYKILER